MKQLVNEMKYFLNQKLYVTALALTAICGYGFAIIHPIIGIDDTAVELYIEEGLEVVMGRWTVFLLNKLFHMSEFSPFMLELVGVLMLCVAATLFVVLFYRLFGEKISIVGYSIFACVFASNPIISEVYIYYYHDGVDVGYILTALALIVFMEALEQKGKKKILRFIGSMLLIWAAVGCYESLLILYVLGVLVIVFVRGMLQKDTLTGKYILVTLSIGAALTVGTVILRAFMIPFLTKLFALESVVGLERQRSLFEIFGLLKNEQGLEIFTMLLKRFWVVYYVNAVVYLPVAGYVLAVAVFGVCAVILTKKQKNIWYLLLFIGMLITPFLLTMMEVQVTHYRSCQYIPFYTACGVLILYQAVAKRKKSPVLRYGMTLFAVVLIYNQAAELNHNFYIDQTKYQDAKETLNQIALDIEREYGKDIPVVFTGSYDVPQSLIDDYYVDYSSWQYQWIAKITDVVDVHLKEKYFTPYGYSFIGEAQFPFIEWGFDAFDGTNREMINFLRMHGHSFPMITDEIILREAQSIGDTMPHWPAEGSITLQEGYILVHI